MAPSPYSLFNLLITSYVSSCTSNRLPIKIISFLVALTFSLLPYPQPLLLSLFITLTKADQKLLIYFIEDRSNILVKHLGQFLFLLDKKKPKPIWFRLSQEG
jgi:hypothetical protein